MIDAVDVIFREHRADRVIDGAGRGEALADRLLHHDARVLRQPMASDALADRAEQFGAGGKIEDADTLGAAEKGGKLGPAFIGTGADRDIGQPFDEALQHRLVALGRRHVALQRLAGEGAEAGIIHHAP